MPDKAKFLSEVYRVLKPGGVFLCATWCHRETPPALSADENLQLARISHNYSLPRWVPLSLYRTVASRTGFSQLRWEDWSADVQEFWPAVLWSVVSPPTNIIRLLFAGWTTIKGAITAVLMMRGFQRGLIVFGAFSAVKPGVLRVTRLGLYKQG